MAFGLKSTLVTVAAAGHPIAGPSVLTKLLILQPANENSGNVFVGGSDELMPKIYLAGEAAPLVITAPPGGELDLSTFYADAVQNGDGVVFCWLDYIP